MFAKHDASSVTGILIKYEPKDSYNRDFVMKPVSDFGIPDSSPSQKNDTENIPVSVPVEEKDSITEVILQDSETNIIDQSKTKETQIDLDQNTKFLNELGLKISGKLSPNINILPFDLSSNVNILNQMTPSTVVQLLGIVLKGGARFYMNNYEYMTDGIKTIDDSVSVRFDDSAKGSLIPIKDVFDIVTVAWFSKNAHRLFDLKALQAWLSTKVENHIRYEVKKSMLSQFMVICIFLVSKEFHQMLLIKENFSISRI
jgi:hypothetical protein